MCQRRTMSPITFGIYVSQEEAALLPQRDVRHSPCNLPRHECSSTSGALMIEQDAIACKYVVGFAVVDNDPVCIELRHAIGRARVERSGFGLGRLNDLSVELRGGRLVEADVLLETARADGV